MKAAIFDVDGTILDTMPLWETLAQKYLKTKGIIASDEINKKMLSMTVPQAAVCMRDEYGLNLDAKIIESEVLQLTENFYRQEAPLKEGILDCIKFFHKNNIPMIVASSGIKELIEAAFERLEISEYFGKIFTGDKNNPGLFNECLTYLGARPEEVLVFEDGIHAIQTARTMGLKTVLIKDIQKNYDEIKALADFTMEDGKWKQF